MTELPHEPVGAPDWRAITDALDELGVFTTRDRPVRSGHRCALGLIFHDAA